MHSRKKKTKKQVKTSKHKWQQKETCNWGRRHIPGAKIPIPAAQSQAKTRNLILFRLLSRVCVLLSWTVSFCLPASVGVSASWSSSFDFLLPPALLAEVVSYRLSSSLFITSPLIEFLSKSGRWCPSSLDICLPFVLSYLPTGPFLLYASCWPGQKMFAP